MRCSKATSTRVEAGGNGFSATVQRPGVRGKADRQWATGDACCVEMRRRRVACPFTSSAQPGSPQPYRGAVAQGVGRAPLGGCAQQFLQRVHSDTATQRPTGRPTTRATVVQVCSHDHGPSRAGAPVRRWPRGERVGVAVGVAERRGAHVRRLDTCSITHTRTRTRTSKASSKRMEKPEKHGALGAVAPRPSPSQAWPREGCLGACPQTSNTAPTCSNSMPPGVLASCPPAVTAPRASPSARPSARTNARASCTERGLTAHGRTLHAETASIPPARKF
jgi:hypothetical protein